MNAKLSILTPSYNSGQFLERAIQSVQTQSYSNWEHIIVDGGSTDNTPKILKRYPHLKWVSEKDQGQSDAMNKAFAMATGEIIAYLNADDAFEEEAFMTVIQFFEKHLDCPMVVGQLKVVAPNGAYSVRMPSLSLTEILNLERHIFPLNPVSYFYKRRVQEKVGSFPIDNHFAMDYWFLLRAYWNFKPTYIGTVLGAFYFHPDNKSTNHIRGKQALLTTRHQFLLEIVESIKNKLCEMPIEQDQILNYCFADSTFGGLHSKTLEAILLAEKEHTIQQLKLRSLEQEKSIQWHQNKQIQHNQIGFLLRKIINLIITKFLNIWSSKSSKNG